MPFQVIHDGLVREFELILPVGWEYWLETLYSSTSRDGLPLVILLHGAGQDPKVLLDQWPMHELLNRDDDEENKFILMVPYGFATMDPEAPGAPKCEQKTFRPVRQWNAGIGGASTPQVDDVGFIEAAIDAVKAYMQERLDALGSSRLIVDPDRVFLFGYSNGGLFAYHLANQKPDYFAALWVMAGAYGANPYSGYGSVVENSPNPSGSKGISLMAHHGGNDTTIPPGTAGTVSGTTVSGKIAEDLEDAGLSATDAADYAPAMRTLSGAIDAFVSHNNGIFSGPPAFPTTPNVTQSGNDLDGSTGSTDNWYFRTGNSNPAVREYRDPAMDHINFTGSPYRYFGAGAVWFWFKNHPRV